MGNYYHISWIIINSQRYAIYSAGILAVCTNLIHLFIANFGKLINTNYFIINNQVVIQLIMLAFINWKNKINYTIYVCIWARACPYSCGHVVCLLQ